MPSPFPGVDPYLERPGLWPNVHNTLILGYRDSLAAQLRPRYFVSVEERIYIADESDEWEKPTAKVRVPDVLVTSGPGWEEIAFSQASQSAPAEIDEPIVAVTWFEEEVHEPYLEIVDIQSNEVVTVIEVLSPSNKVPGSPGRESFEGKRRAIMNSAIHWVEVDLLRGDRLVHVPRTAGSFEYLVHVSRKGQRPRGQLYPIG